MLSKKVAEPSGLGYAFPAHSHAVFVAVSSMSMKEWFLPVPMLGTADFGPPLVSWVFGDFFVCTWVFWS